MCFFLTKISKLERKASKVKTESIEDSRRYINRQEKKKSACHFVHFFQTNCHLSRSSVIEEDSQSGDSSTYPLKADSMSDFEIEGPLGMFFVILNF